MDNLNRQAVIDAFEKALNPLNITGDGMSKRECQKLLISEMNKIIKERNLERLEAHRLQNARYEIPANWYDQGKDDFEPVWERNQPAAPLVLAPLFKGRKNINEAVFMARQRGLCKELLRNAGF